MPDKVFIDSNLWIYLYSNDIKGTTVKSLVDKHFKHIVISTQILGEIFNVLTKKKIKDKLQAREIICDLKETFYIAAVYPDSIDSAINISIRYGYSYWDSLVISSAIENKCTRLYSEDMQHGQIVDGTVTITNPFMQ